LGAYEIRNAAIRAEFTRTKARAKSLEDFQALADSYAHDNEDLRAELLSREEEIAETQKRLAELEFKNRSLRFHLRQARPEVSDDANDEDVEPDAIQDNTTATLARDGEVRFYKKRYSTQSRDVMVDVGDCGHNSWQGAAKAEKAKKGIVRFEGRGDWKTIQHCGRCEGGGMWRVRW